MADQALHDQIAAFFSERLHLTVSSPAEDLFETGVMDSMAFVDLVMHLEQQFDIRISTGEMEPDNFRSVEKIAAFVAAHDRLERTASAAISMRPKANQKAAAVEG